MTEITARHLLIALQGMSPRSGAEPTLQRRNTR